MNSCNRVIIIIYFAFSFGQGIICHAQQTHQVNVSINQGSECQIVSVQEELPFDYHVYPNPVKDELIIISPQHDVRVSILDLFGRIAVSETEMVENKIQINVRCLAKGVYYVRLKSERRTQHSKIFIHE